MQAVTIATPGLAEHALLLALCLAPFAIVLALGRHPLMQRLPAPLRTGLPLFTGLAGISVGVIGLWLTSANGAWKDSETLYLRASRAFAAQIPLAKLQPEAARPVALESLEADGRLRAPRYAAGWYRDLGGRRVFVLYAGTALTRIPTAQDFDIALGIAEPEALRANDLAPPR